MTSASPRSILVFSGRYHIISTASIVNNCIILPLFPNIYSETAWPNKAKFLEETSLEEGTKDYKNGLGIVNIVNNKVKP